MQPGKVRRRGFGCYRGRDSHGRKALIGLEGDGPLYCLVSM